MARANLHRLALAVTLLPASVFAQRAWIVDAANGPGTDFTDLPPALRAVAAGDRIQIRRGGYRGGTLRQPVRIVAEPGVALEGGTLLVERLPTGSRCEIVGVDVAPLFGDAIHLRDNRGVVVLHDITRFGCCGVTVRITDCDLVVLSGAIEDVIAKDSSVVIGSAVITSDADSRAAYSAENCATWVTDAVLIGGPSAASGNPFALGPGSGITAIDGTLRIAGSVSIQAGPSVGQNSRPACGLSVLRTVVELDPAVTITGALGPPVCNGGQVTYTSVPGTGVRGGDLGGVLFATLGAPAGRIAAIFASLGATPTPTPFGLLLLDPVGLQTLATGTTAAHGLVSPTIPVPPDPTLAGTPLFVQGVVLLPGLTLALPTSVVLG